MSTILRGFTSVLFLPLVEASPLKPKAKSAADNRVVFTIAIADRNFGDFDGQVADVIRFLNTNRDHLQWLQHNITDLKLDIDIGYAPKFSTGVLAVEGLLFPLEALTLASALRIELLLSLYDGNRFE